MARSIRKWLDGLGLARYAEAFEENELDLDLAADLSDSDLKDLGVLAMGHRKKLLRAIDALGPEATQHHDPDEAKSPPQKSSLNSPAERRQLTVMFCDLVGSTALSGRLDPEDMREVLRRYQDAVTGVITRHEGYVANYLGDGVLAYFGWPRAYEDQAVQAVRAGLSAVDVVSGIAIPSQGDERLAARVGIATGEVVVGDLVGESASQQGAISGETPNLAARLQGIAQSGEVVVGAVTQRLLANGFDLVDRGEQSLKGIANPVRAWRVLGERTVESRFEATHGESLTQLVGRDHELGLLLDRWRQAQAGEGQMVLLTGEAGIGKSRIARALTDAMSIENHVRIGYQCSPYHIDSALHPAIQQLTLASRINADDEPEIKLDKLETLLRQAQDDVSTSAPLLAELLGFEEAAQARYGRLDYSPQQKRRRTLEALRDQLTGLATNTPVLFVLEDAHWIDPTTLELVELFLENLDRVSAMLLITARPTFEDAFGGHPTVTRLPLNRLGREQASSIVSRITKGKALPPELLDEIAAKTDGVPLFIEELTKTVLESGQLRETETAWLVDGPLSRIAIPMSLQDSLMARLDRIPEVKPVAQIASVLGRTFDYRLLAAVADRTESELQAALDQLAATELLFGRGSPPDATFTFKHGLVRDAAYQSLLKSDRQHHHTRIARVLEEMFADTAENEPELLAYHFTEAGLAGPAVDNWLKAGQHAMQRSANVEAERHLRTGLAVLETMPVGPERRRREVTLQNTLGVCLMPTRGFGDAEIADAFTTAAVVSEEDGDAHGLFVALRGKGQYQMISGDLPTAQEQTDRILELAETANDQDFLIEAHHLGWSALTFTGDFDDARRHAEAGIALYDRERHHGLTYVYSGHDPGVCCRSFGALATWQLGYPDQALAQCLNGLALAQELAHPFSVTIALWGLGILHLLRRDIRAAHETGETLLEHSIEKGILPFVPVGKIYRGGALAEEGKFAEGIPELRDGIGGVRKIGTEYTVPTYLAWLAELCIKGGLITDGHKALEEGLAMARKNRDRFSLPELHRIRGELMLADAASSKAKAGACFEEAIEMARCLNARSFELRAATSLARLWGENGKREEAHHLLAPVYGWFSEGFETVDLKAARTLLSELS